MEAQIKLEDVAPVRRDVTRLLSIIAHSFLPRRSQFPYTKYNSRKDKKIKSRKKEDRKKKDWNLNPLMGRWQH